MNHRTLVALFAALALGTAATAGAQAQNWYRGNTHTHTINDGGNVTPDAVVRWYREHHYQFVVITDHDFFTDVEPLNRLYGAEGLFLILPGQEVTQELRDSSHPGGERSAHLNAINSSRLVKGIAEHPTNRAHPVAPEGATTMAKSYLRNMTEIRAAGGFPQINHPNWHWSVRPADLFDISGPTLLEIWNGIPGINNLGGTDETGERALSTEELWDVLLSRGKIIWGVGSDDSHDFLKLDDPGAERPGQAWIVVRAERLSAEAIMAALERGEFYASNGITLEDYTASTREISIDLKRGGGRTITDTRFITRFIGKHGRLLAEVPGTHPRYTIKGNEGYVRASIMDSNGRRAWTQPVFVQEQ